eukprot:434558_1
MAVERNGNPALHVYIPTNKMCYIRHIDTKTDATSVTIKMWDNGDKIKTEFKYLRPATIYEVYTMKDFKSNMLVMPEESCNDADSVIVTVRLPQIFSGYILTQRSRVNKLIKLISKDNRRFQMEWYNKTARKAKRFMQKEQPSMDKYGIQLSVEASCLMIELMCCRHCFNGDKIIMETLKEWESLDCYKCCKMFKTNKCKVCGVKKNESKLYKCSNCRSVKYCSKKCQKIDWKAKHYLNCKRATPFIYCYQ